MYDKTYMGDMYLFTLKYHFYTISCTIYKRCVETKFKINIKNMNGRKIDYEVHSKNMFTLQYN